MIEIYQKKYNCTMFIGNSLPRSQRRAVFVCKDTLLRDVRYSWTRFDVVYTYVREFITDLLSVAITNIVHIPCDTITISSTFWWLIFQPVRFYNRRKVRNSYFLCFLYSIKYIIKYFVKFEKTKQHLKKIKTTQRFMCD